MAGWQTEARQRAENAWKKAQSTLGDNHEDTKKLKTALDAARVVEGQPEPAKGPGGL